MPQPTEGVSYAAKIDKDEARVDWTRTAAEVDRLGSGPSVPALLPVDRDTVSLDLSYAQQRLWFIDRFGFKWGAGTRRSATD